MKIEKLIIPNRNLEQEHSTITLSLADKHNFEIIYNTYFERMHTRAYSKTKSKDVASNIVQDIFIHLWEKRDSLEIKTSVEQYLMRCLKFKIIDYFRAQEVYRKHSIARSSGAFNFDRSTEEQLELNELKGRLTNLVEQLPTTSQKVYRLSREKGHSNREISKHLAVSERTVSSHLAKALCFLKRHLKGDYGTLN